MGWKGRVAGKLAASFVGPVTLFSALRLYARPGRRVITFTLCLVFLCPWASYFNSIHCPSAARFRDRILLFLLASLSVF